MIDSTSLNGMKGFFTKRDETVHRRQVLIMDEVDGMSAGDRGGMAELILLIKKTKIPIICICNDRASPKVRSLANYCLDLRFRRPDARQVLPRIMAIAEKEGLSIQPNALEELVTSTHADIRQILNLLSTYKLTQQNLSFDQSKSLYPSFPIILINDLLDRSRVQRMWSRVLLTPLQTYLVVKAGHGCPLTKRSTNTLLIPL